MKTDSQIPIRRLPVSEWFHSAGFSMDTNRPLVGVVVCHSDILCSLPQTEILYQNVEKGLQAAGGHAFRLNLLNFSTAVTPKPGESVGQFPLRDMLADQLECLASESGVAGLVLMADRSEASTGLLLGAARLNLPTIFVPLRGSLNAEDHKSDKNNGKSNGKSKDAGLSLGESGNYSNYAISLLTEVMGLSLPMSSTVPEGSIDHMRLAQSAGQRVVELIKHNFMLQRVLMANAFMNAIRFDAAMGGWSGTVVFLHALAREAAIKLSLEAFATLGRSTPHICRLNGEKNHTLRDLHELGGVPAILTALRGQWLPCPMVSGRSMNELSKSVRLKPHDLLRLKTPHRKEGGLVVLRGNLAPVGAIYQMPSGAHQRSVTHNIFGPARIFDSREEAVKALQEKKIKSNDVLVIRYEGPKGGPGLRCQSKIVELLAEQGLAKSVALITDGWCAESTGPTTIIEMVSPEAMEGSPLAILKEGDRICIDIDERQLSVQLTDMDIKLRTVRWKSPAPRVRNGYWARYARSVGSALEGAVLK